MNLSLLQPVYTVPLWHFWVENAHGGSCMNCSFRRMKLKCFFLSSVLLSNGDCSLWNLVLVHLSTTEV